MSGKARTPTEISKQGSWDWLTVMDGPEVSGKGKIWFGKIEDSWEQLNEDFEIVLCAEPVEHIPLPRAMTRPEIEDFLSDDWGDRIIERYTTGNEQ